MQQHTDERSRSIFEPHCWSWPAPELGRWLKFLSLGAHFSSAHTASIQSWTVRRRGESFIKLFSCISTISFVKLLGADTYGKTWESGKATFSTIFHPWNISHYCEAEEKICLHQTNRKRMKNSKRSIYVVLGEDEESVRWTIGFVAANIRRL